MYHGGFTHAGASKADGPTSTAHAWTFTHLGPHSEDGISPVVGPGGIIYLLEGTGGHTPFSRLRAISPTTHKTLWSFSHFDGAFRSTPAVAPDGDVYVVTDGQGYQLIAIGSGGEFLWQLTGLGLQGSPTIGRDGICRKRKLRAIRGQPPQRSRLLEF